MNQKKNTKILLIIIIVLFIVILFAGVAVAYLATDIFRSDKDCYTDGDVIEFRVIKNEKEVLHRINSRKYVVTAVMDCMQAPIEKGYMFIGFRQMR